MNKKYRLIILSFVVVVLLAGITVYALVSNNDSPTNESGTPKNQITSSENGEFVPDISSRFNANNAQKKEQEENNSNTTYIYKEDGETGPVYEFTLEDINRDKNGVVVGNTVKLGDYIYTYGYTATRAGGTIENGGLVPQDTGYELGWHVEVKNKNQETYGPLCEYIYGIPVTDVTYLFAECNNITEDGYPELPRCIKFDEHWK